MQCLIFYIYSFTYIFQISWISNKMVIVILADNEQFILQITLCHRTVQIFNPFHFLNVLNS